MTFWIFDSNSNHFSVVLTFIAYLDILLSNIKWKKLKLTKIRLVPMQIQICFAIKTSPQTKKKIQYYKMIYK